MNPIVSIIILNWNGWKDTIECLESLYQINYLNYDIIIVDNASQDDSIEKIREYCEGMLKVNPEYFKYDSTNKTIEIFEYTEKESIKINSEDSGIKKSPSNKKLILIKSDKNYGFAEGNNIGFKYAMETLNPDYILLLNNDTFVDRRFLHELVEVAETDEKIGSVQSLLLNPGGRIIDSLGQELFIWGASDKAGGSNYENIPNENIEIFGACAAAALYRSKILKKTGLFDEDFFVMFEDVDLSWKINLEGFKSVLVFNSIVYHKRGISAGKSNPLILYHQTKNWLIIWIKYYPALFILNGIIKNPRNFLQIFNGFYISLKLRRFWKFFRLLAKNLRIRRELKNNPFLNHLQKKWINK